jgi:hypothetical protein
MSTCWICTPSTINPRELHAEIERQSPVMHPGIARQQAVHITYQLVDVRHLAPHVLVADQRANAGG